MVRFRPPVIVTIVVHDTVADEQPFRHSLLRVSILPTSAFRSRPHLSKSESIPSLLLICAILDVTAHFVRAPLSCIADHALIPNEWFELIM